MNFGKRNPHPHKNTFLCVLFTLVSLCLLTCGLFSSSCSPPPTHTFTNIDFYMFFEARKFEKCIILYLIVKCVLLICGYLNQQIRAIYTEVRFSNTLDGSLLLKNLKTFFKKCRVGVKSPGRQEHCLCISQQMLLLLRQAGKKLRP